MKQKTVEYETETETDPKSENSRLKEKEKVAVGIHSGGESEVKKPDLWRSDDARDGRMMLRMEDLQPQEESLVGELVGSPDLCSMEAGSVIVALVGQSLVGDNGR
ncbi:hypothetical protein L2E82_06555 [Cichorium intybus]|uniref:Uncharacterized protein n=1 Tax=Cichorium intybus TaxID=13427 RepID=A0ACB9HAC1_CICIN|nr:hypothetical protein L2E82_06555 [Cichorium intybus]